MSINILYCFDNNYEKQATTSMLSLLDKISEPVDLYIIHQHSKNYTNASEIIKRHKNTKSINIFEFERNKIKFPNVVNSHVSEATYYRLFIEELLPLEIENILYLDCDIICHKDPVGEIKNTFERLKETEYSIAVSNEEFEPEEKKEITNRLNIDADDYFNAGVMFIDLQKWKNNSIPTKALEIISKESKNLKYWDQDILNMIYNKNSLSISNKFNFMIDIQSKVGIPEDTLFLHYAGSFKPWTVRGAVEKNAVYYIENYRKLNLGDFHITHTWRWASLINLFKSILNFKIINTKKPLSFIKATIESLIRY
jgi:lipopolysaccharide biosynthesis glycosyltransferase